MTQEFVCIQFQLERSHGRKSQCFQIYSEGKIFNKKKMNPMVQNSRCTSLQLFAEYVLEIEIIKRYQLHN